jgi:hypothetical protein
MEAPALGENSQQIPDGKRRRREKPLPYVIVYLTLLASK